MARAGRHVGLAAAAVLAVAFAAGLAAPPSAHAHVPTLEQRGRNDPAVLGAAPYSNAQPIEDPVKSLAVYGFLAHDEQTDAYAFSVPRATSVEVELLVPVRAGLRGFAPVLQVVEAKTYDAQTLQPAGRDRFYEPFSLASFWRVAQGSVSLVPGRQYFFVVRGGSGSVQSGAYVIGVGGPEAFTGADWTETLRVLPVIWSGAWGGGPLRPGALLCFGVGLVLVPLAIVLVIRRRRRSATA